MPDENRPLNHAKTSADGESAWREVPYPGLRAFTPREAPVFFGRSRETDSLLRLCADPANRLVAVTGAAGVGKSSLLEASLIPRLGGSSRAIVRFTPGQLGDDPFLALVSALAPSAADDHKAHHLARHLQERPARLSELVGEVLASQPGRPELLLVIDQFEELFELNSTAYRARFIDMLNITLRRPGLRVVIALREDYIQACLQWPQLGESIKQGMYTLPAAGFGALYEIVTKPALLVGAAFEPDLVPRILSDTGTDPGNLALLAFTLAELYREREANSRLTHAAYERIGAVRGALDRCAEALYGSLDEQAQQALGAVFRELIEMDEQGAIVPRRAPLSRIDETPGAGALVAAFVDRGLLIKSRGEYGTVLVAMAQAALLKGWSRLAHWVRITTEDLRLLWQLRQGAAQWRRQGLSSSLLWPQERLLPIYAMTERLQPHLSVMEKSFLRSEPERLLEEIDLPGAGHQRRALIGERLAQIGDPRAGVGLDQRGLPDIVWCSVPGGEIGLEGGGRRFRVAPFYIAKYPLTRAQYRVFLQAADGYRQERWWVGLAHRDTSPGEQRWSIDNHPADNVSWYDAVAYCRWLSKQLGFEVGLPTEWQWQQAATALGPAAVYPWGGAWDGERANTSESGLNRTTAVGLYPHGASPTGVQDMSGTVWEWCRNVYDPPEQTEPAGEERRVLRGGAWQFDKECARVVYRDLDRPGVRSDIIGFRLVCAAPG